MSALEIFDKCEEMGVHFQITDYPNGITITAPEEVLRVVQPLIESRFDDIVGICQELCSPAVAAVSVLKQMREQQEEAYNDLLRFATEGAV